MKQSIRRARGSGSLKDTGSRECYYFYISLHLSPILKQLNVFLLVLALALGLAWGLPQLQSGARGSSPRDLGPEKRLGLGISYLMTLPWGGWQRWGNWTPTSDMWVQEHLKQPGALPVLVKGCFADMADPVHPSPGGWAVFFSWSPASHTCCLFWDFSTFSPMFHFCFWGRKRSSL